jgi:hypothetical protein
MGRQSVSLDRDMAWDMDMDMDMDMDVGVDMDMVHCASCTAMCNSPQNRPN